MNGRIKALFGMRYIVLSVIILVLLLALMLRPYEWASKVTPFRGAVLQQQFFDPMIAKTINGSHIDVIIDNEAKPGLSDDIYIDRQLNAMCDLTFVRRVFDCSARVYDNDSIILERGPFSCTLKTGLYDIQTAGEAEDATLSAPPAEYNGEIFVPVADIAGRLGYNVVWDRKKLTLSIDTAGAVPLVLPVFFDLRLEGRAPAIRNQGSESTCWAYAATGAIESSLLPEERAAFDPADMIENRGYSFTEQDGGDFSQALAYLLSWKGPVSKDNTNEASLRGEKHLQEARVFGSDDIDSIKKAVYLYGGVSTSIYAAAGGVSGSSYYNPAENAYCCNGSFLPNHDVVIIGWADDFPKQAFNGAANGNGAFICQNSWGADFGDNGVFYVSYYDTNVGNQAVSYSAVEDADNYDIIHQSDLCGWTGQIGYSSENVLGANVFTAESDERLKAAGFYSLGKNTFYEIYVVTDFKDTSSLSQRTLAASGSVADKGFYTVTFNTPFEIKKDSRFAVILSITTPGTEQPMAIEYTSERMADEVDISDGESYISGNGLDWDSVEKTSNGNLCIKAYASLAGLAVPD